MALVHSTKLHRVREKLAQECEDLLTNGEPCFDREGNVVMIDGKPLMKRPTAATLSVIRQFLRDNGVVVDPIESPGDKPALTDSLPFEEPSEIKEIALQDDTEF